ncbi:MAG: HIT family protein, partial [Promethearchaeota archaeon]
MDNEDPLFKDNLIARGKAKYVRGEKPDVECILCAVRDDNPAVEAKTLYQDDTILVTLNIYPFNPGHVMIIPCRHVERWRDLSINETQKLIEFTRKSQEILEVKLGAKSFNVGFNEGPHSGQSIKHFHLHVVPRFKNELGFLDIIGKTRAVVYSIDE